MLHNFSLEKAGIISRVAMDEDHEDIPEDVSRTDEPPPRFEHNKGKQTMDLKCLSNLLIAQ